MDQTDLKIKVSVEAQLAQLRAMEAEFSRNIVKLRALGDTGSEALKTLERNLGLVRTQLANIGGGSKLATALGDMVKDIPVVGAAMSAMNGSALPTAAIIGAVTTAMQQFSSALDFADQLQDTAEQMNVTTTALQVLNAHFADAGLKPAVVSQVLMKLNSSLADAAAGSEPLRKAFGDLGLKIEELRALSPDEALAKIGRAMAEHADAALASAAAQDIFGRGVGRIINSIKDLGSQGMEKVTADMSEAGRVLEKDMVDRLAAANHEWEVFTNRVAIFRGEMAGAATKRYDEVKERPGRSFVEALADASGRGMGTPSAREKVTPEVEAFRAVSAKILADAKAEEERKAREAEKATRLQVQAAAAAEANAKKLAPILEKQAELDAKMLAQHTARLPLAQQIQIAEAELLRIRSQMPKEEDASVEAAKKRLDLGQKAYEQAELLTALQKQFKQEDDDWLERIYAADAERIAARKKERSQARDQDLSRRLAGGDEALQRLQESKMLTSEQKDRARSTILEKQNELIRERIALLEKEQAEQPDPARQTQIDGLRSKEGTNSAEIAALQPLSAGQGAVAGLVQYLDAIPTAAERAQQAVMNIATEMEEGIATSLTGLINQTMTWTQALANIGTSIVQAIIQSFVRMVAQWITQQIIMAVFGKALQAAQLAALAPIALATAAMWAPAATAASIATFGGAAVEGAAMAQTAIWTSALGFAKGGLVTGPGTGTSDSIFTRLSNGEFVVPANRVAQYGVGFFEDIRAGRMPDLAAPAGASGGSGGGASSPGVSMHQAFFFDLEEAVRSALMSPAGRRMFVDLMSGTQHEI